MVTKNTDVPKKARADWDAVERDYRTGRFTLRELEKQHGVSYAQISRKAKEQGWTKDLREVIKQATDAALLHETVTKAQKDVTDTVIVAAELNKQVILGHRQDIAKVRDLTMTMAQELGEVTLNQDKLQELFELMTSDMSEAQMAHARRAYGELTKLPSRIAGAKALAESLTKLQTLERLAFSLDDDDKGDTKEKAVPVFNLILTDEG